MCQWKLGDVAGDRTRCPECDTTYHSECWEENRGCAVYGCPKVPAVEHYAAVEIPVSYWGQETKQCPACKADILAAAVRCRGCGATFANATPLTPDEWDRQQRRQTEQPAYRTRVVWLSVLCVLPWTAPFAGAFGYLWYRRRKREIQSMPALYPALCKIALGVALAQTTLGTLIVLLR